MVSVKLLADIAYSNFRTYRITNASCTPNMRWRVTNTFSVA